jgi:hypothetical protein
MLGAHLGPEVRYPESGVAARYDASVEKETFDPQQAHGTSERFQRARPPYWSRLPWTQLSFTRDSETGPSECHSEAGGSAPGPRRRR